MYGQSVKTETIEIIVKTFDCTYFVPAPVTRGGVGFWVIDDGVVGNIVTPVGFVAPGGVVGFAVDNLMVSSNWATLTANTIDITIDAIEQSAKIPIKQPENECREFNKPLIFKQWTFPFNCRSFLMLVTTCYLWSYTQKWVFNFNQTFQNKHVHIFSDSSCFSLMYFYLKPSLLHNQTFNIFLLTKLVSFGWKNVLIWRPTASYVLHFVKWCRRCTRSAIYSFLANNRFIFHIKSIFF